MQQTSEKCSFLEELICKEDSLKENQFHFKQNQDNNIDVACHASKPAE